MFSHPSEVAPSHGSEVITINPLYLALPPTTVAHSHSPSDKILPIEIQLPFVPKVEPPKVSPDQTFTRIVLEFQNAGQRIEEICGLAIVSDREVLEIAYQIVRLCQAVKDLEDIPREGYLSSKQPTGTDIVENKSVPPVKIRRDRTDLDRYLAKAIKMLNKAWEGYFSARSVRAKFAEQTGIENLQDSIDALANGWKEYRKVNFISSPGSSAEDSDTERTNILYAACLFERDHQLNDAMFAR